MTPLTPPQGLPHELSLTWSPSTDDSDSQALILCETHLNSVLVPDGLERAGFAARAGLKSTPS